MKFVFAMVVLLMASVAQAGLFFGPNVRIVTRHYYGVSAPAAVVYSVSPTDDVVFSAGPAKPHKAARHAGKAAKHQKLADYYSN